MDQPKSNVSTSSMNTVTTRTISFRDTSKRPRMTQNFLLMWVDTNIDRSKENCQNILAQLESVINDVKIFTEPEECVQCLNNIENEKVFIITSGSLGQHLIPNIHALSQVDAIYIFCSNRSQYKEWSKGWVKIKDVHTMIKPICEALKFDVKQCNQNSTAVSFVPVNEEGSIQNLNQLEPSFMYTQIFKEILRNMYYDDKSITDLADYCRDLYNNNVTELSMSIIDEFEHDYRKKSPIWWYTRGCFLYYMLNQALRMLEADTIIKMGYFILHLHEQIKQLHEEQVDSYHEKAFTVYRGQGLSKTDFEKLLKSKGGLMSFNSFLSTSKIEGVANIFAESTSQKTDTVGILFKITIDPSVSSAPFASINEVSFYETEEEILFSMHTVFRVGEITKMDTNEALYQVNLKLTADDDPELRILSKFIRKEVASETGWRRLCLLLMKLNEFDKAEKLYNILIEQTADPLEKAIYYDHLAHIKHRQGDYTKAIGYYEESITIQRKILSPDDLSLARSYNNIALVYNNIGEYSKALSFHENSLKIRQKILHPDDLSLSTSYNNIAMLYNSRGRYFEALSYYEQALKIRQKTLPANHPDLAQSYNNIGLSYLNMGKYSKALSFFEKNIEIQQKSLPAYHPSLAMCYNNIGLAHFNIGEYSKALSSHEKALEIRLKNVPENHPDLAIIHSSIGSVYCHMRNYAIALLFYEAALEIKQQMLPTNRSSFACLYNNIGVTFSNMEEYSKALMFHEKAFEIQQKFLLANHPDLTNSFNSIGHVQRKMGKYTEALSLFEKALQIRQETLSANHPSLAASYNNIAVVYFNIKDYSKALSNFELARNIWRTSLPSNHPNLLNVETHINTLRRIM